MIANASALMSYQTVTRWQKSHHRKKRADASGHGHATAYWDIWQGRRRKGTRLIQGEEIGHGAGSENRERTEEGIPPEL